MPWLVWGIIGATLGWWIEVLFFRPWRGQAAEIRAEPARNENSFERNLLDGFLLGTLLAWLANGQGPPREETAAAPVSEPTPATPPSLLDDPARRRVAVALLNFALFAAALCAAGQYFDWFPAGFYKLKGFLLTNAVLGLAAGGAVGFWISRYRRGITARAAGFYAALLGAESKSSWALQSAVAIFALLLVVLALKPDLLENIESFRAGEIEAKFSSISTTTRQTVRVGFSDLTQEVTIGQWINFRKNFLTGARANALEFDGSSIKTMRMEIRDLLFDHYIEPLAVLLDCLKARDRIDEVRRSQRLITLAVTFRNMILHKNDNGVVGIADKGTWEKLLDLLNEEIKELSDIVETRVPQSSQVKCLKYDITGSDAKDPMTGAGWKPDSIVAIRALVKAKDVVAEKKSAHVGELVKATATAIDQLNKSDDEAKYKVSYIDPYVIAAVGDLVALTLGNNEKANFLTQVKDGYPTDLNFIQPGIINLYFQLSDAKVKVETAWPLDEKIAELEYAMRGVDYMISKSRERAKQESEKATTQPASAANATKYQAIVDLYFRNKVILINRYLEIYVQRYLAGEQITQSDRMRWISYYRQAEEILALKSVGVKLDLSDSDGYALLKEDIGDFRRAISALEARLPALLFDFRNNMALSSIMLTEKNRKASGQACALSKFYLLSAKEMLPDLAKSLELNQAETARMRGYMFQLQARAEVSCPTGG